MASYQFTVRDDHGAILREGPLRAWKRQAEKDALAELRSNPELACVDIDRWDLPRIKSTAGIVDSHRTTSGRDYERVRAVATISRSDLTNEPN